MSHTLPGADIRGYFAALGIALPGWARAEASVRCFACPDTHARGDRDPSCSVNLEHGAWHCHACGAKGGAFDAATSVGYPPRAAIDLMVDYGLTQHRAYRRPTARPRRHPASISRRSPEPPRTPLRATREDIARWQGALAAETDLIATLARERGWRYSAMWELGLGFDRGRVTIPVSDHHERLIGLLRYQPWPKPDEPKMLAAAGSRRALLPHPAAETSRNLLLVEGEPDMLAARSRGLPAIAVPGVDAWRAEWALLFVGTHVAIVMDADREGRQTAKRIRLGLRQQAEATIIDIAPDRADGYDLTQWLLERPNLPLEVLHGELLSLQLEECGCDQIGSRRGRR